MTCDVCCRRPRIERAEKRRINWLRLTMILKGGRGGCRVKCARSFAHIVRIYIFLTNQPTNQPSSQSSIPSVHPPTLHSASRATYHAFGAKAVCRLSSLPPSLARSLAQSHGPRTRTRRANACVVHTMEPYLTAKSTEERER